MGFCCTLAIVLSFKCSKCNNVDRNWYSEFTKGDNRTEARAQGKGA